MNILAGLSLSLGFKFAGTADERTNKLLEEIFDFFLSIRKTARSQKKSSRTTRSLQSHLLHSCLSVTCLAWSMVMAGTGDLNTLGKLRLVSKLYMGDSSFSYGHQMAVHMALGFLFLGGGRRTLGRSNEAIASLLCAVYPVFPTSIIDNRYHMQALRHLYVLAVERRCLVVQDSESKLPSLCPIELTYSVPADFVGITGAHPTIVTKELMAPCLLPPLDSILSLRIKSPLFCPITQTGPLHSTIFLVARRSFPLSSSVPLSSFVADQQAQHSKNAVVFSRYLTTLIDHEKSPQNEHHNKKNNGVVAPSTTLNSFSLFCLSVFRNAHPSLLSTYMEVFQLLQNFLNHHDDGDDENNNHNHNNNNHNLALYSTLGLQNLKLFTLSSLDSKSKATFLDFDPRLSATIRLKWREHLLKLKDASSLASLSLPNTCQQYLQNPLATLATLTHTQRINFGLYLILADVPSTLPNLDNPFASDLILSL